MKRLIVKKEFYKSIKDNDNFLEAIQLCRILGAIQYSKVIYSIASEKEDFNTSLQLILVINQAAYLYEGIKKFNTIKTKLEHLESFQINKDLIDKTFGKESTFFNEVLCYIRSKVAFHFDKHVIVRTLEDLIEECTNEDEDIVFIEGKTDLVKDTKYLLADTLYLRYILGLIRRNNANYEEKFKILAKELLNLSKLFCDILQEIIPELIEDYCELIEQEN
jgi:hypothetical protein